MKCFEVNAVTKPAAAQRDLIITEGYNAASETRLGKLGLRPAIQDIGEIRV